MKKRIIQLIIFLLLLTLVTDKQLEQIIESMRNLRYLISLPEDYEKDTTVRWPVIIFLHGSKERGTNLVKVKENGPPKLIEMGKKLPFIVVSPQIRFSEFWEPGLILNLLKKISMYYRVDEERIYLTGLSMGGYGTWFTALEYPEIFAAIAPVCGGGNPGKAWKIRHLPVWIFHGAKDPVVSLFRSVNMAANLLQYNKMKLTIYPEARHDSWTETYNNDARYKWFLEQRRFRFKEAQLQGLPDNYAGLFSSGKDALTIFTKDGGLWMKPEGKKVNETQLHPGSENSFFFDEHSLNEIKYNLDGNGRMNSFILYTDNPVTYFRVR